MSRIAPFVIALSQTHPRAVTIHAKTQDGAAAGGVDYAAVDQDVVFQPGETSKTINVAIDSGADGGIDFIMNLSDPQRCTLDPPKSSLATIGDTVVQPAVSSPLIRSGLVAEAFHTDDVSSYVHRHAGTATTLAIVIEAMFLAHKALEELEPTAYQKAAFDFYKTAALDMLDAIGGSEKKSPVFRFPYSDDGKRTAAPHWLHAVRQKIDLTGEAKALPGYAFDLRPDLRNLYDFYSSASFDAFRYYNNALKLAAELDDRDGKAAQWETLLSAVRRTDVRARAFVDDQRWMFRPMPKFMPMPYGEQWVGGVSKLYTRSNHPLAEPPRKTEIALGADPLWNGANFVFRDGGSDGQASSEEFIWTPENMKDEKYPGWIGNGAIKVEYPARSEATRGTLNIGRGVNQTWRLAATNVQPDQYLFVAFTCNRRPTDGTGTAFVWVPGFGWLAVPGAPAEHIWCYIGDQLDFDPAHFYHVDVSRRSDFVATSGVEGLANQYETTDGTKHARPSYMLIPVGDFKRYDNDAPLTAGTTIASIGFEIDMYGPVEFEIIAMRLVSGSSTTWVQSNLKRAVKGDIIPYSPAVAPLMINANARCNLFLDYMGCPFSGYQFPDYWPDLATHVDAIFEDMTPAELPVPNLSGANTYPIVEKVDNVLKPRAALLMEQQLMFLRDAQAAHLADGGPNGPFAHTYVLNTRAANFLATTPWTWTYSNLGIDTREGIYQARVIESVAKVVFERDEDGYKAARTLAKTVALTWLAWFDSAWVSGDPPSRFPSPFAGAPEAVVGDPSMAALVLRACLWLNGSGQLTPVETTKYKALAERCWSYINSKWRAGKTDTMRFTWAPTGGSEFYFGAVHFEVIATIAQLVLHYEHSPIVAPKSRLKARLAQTRWWIARNTVKA